MGAIVWDAAPLSASSCGASGREGCGVSSGSFRDVSGSGTGAASSDAGREDTSAQADSSSGDSRRASMAGRASASTGNVSPSSQRSRATGRRAESRTAAIALRRLSAPAVTAVIHSVAAARTMAARRVKRLFFTGIPPQRYRQAYAAAERDMIFSLQNGAKSGIMQRGRIWLI